MKASSGKPFNIQGGLSTDLFLAHGMDFKSKIQRSSISSYFGTLIYILQLRPRIYIIQAFRPLRIPLCSESCSKLTSTLKLRSPLQSRTWLSCFSRMDIPSKRTSTPFWLSSPNCTILAPWELIGERLPRWKECLLWWSDGIRSRWKQLHFFVFDSLTIIYTGTLWRWEATSL